MHEFNGWAVIRSDEATEEGDAEMFARLVAYLDEEVDEGLREAFHVGDMVNGHRSLLVSGLRNHHRAAVDLVFYWLADQGRRSYGLLYFNDDEWPDVGAQWHVMVLRDGTFTMHDDPFFG